MLDLIISTLTQGLIYALLSYGVYICLLYTSGESTMKLKRIIAGLSAAVLFCAGLPALSGCQGTDGKFTLSLIHI